MADGKMIWRDAPIRTLANADGTYSLSMSRVPTTFKPLSALSVAAETTVWTPAAGKKFRLVGGIVACSVAGNLTFKDNTAGATILVVPCLAGAPVNIAGIVEGILSASANNVLTVTGPAVGTVSGTLWGTEE